MARSLSLDALRPLGRSSLRVSPICLGSAAIGQPGRAAGLAAARCILDSYLDRGGNFIDAASPGGGAELFIGRALAGKRDAVVIATKCFASIAPGHRPDGGSPRARLKQSVEASLRRLATDRIDLLYLQTGDGGISPEEAMLGLDDLVRGGKVRHAAIANAPGWRVAEMQILASARGWSPLVALQAEYNLIQRRLEQELGPTATVLDLDIVAWSPLAAGLLSGSHRRSDAEQVMLATASLPGVQTLADDGSVGRAYAVAKAVDDIALECGASPAQVALAWTLLNPAIAASIVNVRSVHQLEDQLGALDLVLSRRQRARLEAISAGALPFPRALMGQPTIVNRILTSLRHEARALNPSSFR